MRCRHGDPHALRLAQCGQFISSHRGTAPLPGSLDHDVKVSGEATHTSSLNPEIAPAEVSQMRCVLNIGKRYRIDLNPFRMRNVGTWLFRRVEYSTSHAPVALSASDGGYLAACQVLPWCEPARVDQLLWMTQGPDR